MKPGEQREKGMPKWCFRRKDSPFIWYKFKVNGKTYTGPTETIDKKAAGEIVAVKRGEAVSGKVKPKKTDISFEKLIEEYLYHCRKQPSVSSKEDCLNNIKAAPRFKGKKASEITRDDCAWYKNWRTDYVKKSSVNRELTVLRHMYNTAVGIFGYELENPVAKLPFYSEKPFQRKRFMTAEEKAAFFADPETPQHTKDVVLFVIKSGLRQGELRALEVADLDFGNDQIFVRAGEEDEPRHVPMHPDVRPVLARWAAKAKALKSRWVFHNPDGTQLSRHGWITTSFEWACRRNKIQNLHFHDLRHTFASDFVMRGGDFKTLGEYMGHSTTTMTDRYAHLSPKYKASQILLLPSEKAFESVPNVVSAGYASATQGKAGAASGKEKA